MPKTTRSGAARRSELPSTLQRSGEKAQRTYAHAYDAAIEQYDGDEERAHRVAFAALKHTHEKVGDSWRPKAEPGPSDPHAEQGGGSTASTAGGVDANASKTHLYDVAKELDIAGRSRMSKAELVEAITRENDRRSRQARA
ncbi:ChaB family protein [Cellulomonas fengjieae]|uniref:ChaB family protein n=1 Tax=Cellulomonas fengjieae TaxID=2819978 RepID=A0ABS3SLJ3_9CELL|nr:ChaB family protein [Cellulomonas fengjieae]MBO3085865.1 ChaB family protein [Cellulomonas fengjieae]QVI67440.1 ChaB family protein [Cellulomonas fengjieae]